MVTPVRRTRVKPVQEKRNGSIMVMSSGFGIAQEDRQEIEVEPFEVEPAYVRINVGQTISTGNYESLRVDVAITLPCYAEEVAEVSERVSEEVGRILLEEEKRWGVDHG